ncbi:MAG: IS110 family transposase [Planctomycetota bacterium]|jgi:hypothetical protein
MKSVGIDYHKRYSVLSIVDEDGEIVAEERIEHAFAERFGEVIGAQTPCQVALESTMNWSWLYELLEQISGVDRIVMANPLHVRLIGAAQVQTDKVDARKLAQWLRANLLPRSPIPDRPTRLRKEVLRQRTFWVRERTKIRTDYWAGSMAWPCPGPRIYLGRRAGLHWRRWFSMTRTI